MQERKEEKPVSGIEKTREYGETRRPERGERFVDRIIPRDKLGNKVENWLEKIEKDPSQTQLGNTTSPLVPVKQAPDDVFLIPISKKNFILGFRQSIDDVARWLSVFVLRIIKKKNGKVKFSQEE